MINVPRRRFALAAGAAAVFATLSASAPGVQVQAAAATSATAPPAAAGSVARGTRLFNPAQIAAIVARTPYVKGLTHPQRLQAAGLAGDIAIKGRVVRSGKSLVVDHVEGPFRSRMRVSPGIDLTAHEGRDVVVAGRFEAWPSSLAFLRKSRLVDGRGLAPSSEPAVSGMVRAAVDADVIRTAPGKGLDSGDVAGVLYHGRGATNAYGSYAFVEDAIVLLRDGWAYHRLDVAPSDLNVKVSRDVEPQRWSKWRRAGGGFEIRRMDDHARLADAWVKAEGTLQGPWPSGTRLRGPYTSAAFHGSIALGGTYVKNTHTFGDDGRYEGSNFAQSSAGSMAANNGFTSTTTSRGDKTGTRSTSGSTSSGGVANPSAPGVTVTSNTARDDGAQRRGRYVIDGYTLEIRRDSGRVDRYLTFWSTGDRIWIGSSTFGPTKK